MSHTPSSANSASLPMDEKAGVAAHIEAVQTNERVPGHANYYEKDGLRTYGDDEDHDHEPPVRAERSKMEFWEKS